MAWKLDNPYSYDPGDGAPIESYTHIKIVHFAFSMEEVMRTELAIHLRHGTMRTLDEEVVFIPGKRNFVAVVFKDFHEVLDGAGGVLKEADPVLSIFMATAIGTAADLFRWGEALRRGGELDGARILSPAMLDKIADETKAIESADLVKFLQGVKHPALTMPPLV